MKTFYTIFLATLVFFSSFGLASAFIFRPLGGTILIYPLEGIKCPTSTTQGQFSIKPVNIASPLPYLVLTESTKNPIRAGVLFKGNYLATPLPVCYTDTSPPVVVPTFIIQTYQTSLK